MPVSVIPDSVIPDSTGPLYPIPLYQVPPSPDQIDVGDAHATPLICSVGALFIIDVGK